MAPVKGRQRTCLRILGHELGGTNDKKSKSFRYGKTGFYDNWCGEGNDTDTYMKSYLSGDALQSK